MSSILDLLNSPEWQEMQEDIEKRKSEFEKECDSAWNSLDQETKLKMFCAVSSRIYKGELQDKGTYRYILYDIFEFGPEAYAPAMEAGFLSIHNSILDDDRKKDIVEKLTSFCKQYNIPEEEIEKFLKQFFY